MREATSAEEDDVTVGIEPHLGLEPAHTAHATHDPDSLKLPEMRLARWLYRDLLVRVFEAVPARLRTGNDFSALP